LRFLCALKSKGEGDSISWAGLAAGWRRRRGQRDIQASEDVEAVWFQGQRLVEGHFTAACQLCDIVTGIVALATVATARRNIRRGRR